LANKEIGTTKASRYNYDELESTR